jgi:5-methylthioadenosine/S-adenosylhomocysteine deaminase
MPVVPYVKKQGLFEAKVIAAHCVHIDEGEIHTLQHNSAGVAHNPSSNLKLASGMAPIKKMLELGVKVGIGTDGPASNNDLDMFEETRLAAFIAKVATDNPTSVPAKQAFSMATRTGAEALHIGDITGSLEPGKRADIAVVDLRRAHNWPHSKRSPDSIYSQLVYAAKSTDVIHVMCNGKWLMQGRNLLTLDRDALLDPAERVAEKIDVFLGAREGDVLSRLLAIGELQREESFEVQVKARVDSATAVETLLQNSDIEVIRQSHYKQYDTYFEFDASDTRIRYREDESLSSNHPAQVRSRLTLMERTERRDLGHAVLLSRSRYISPATRSLRFYQEYFHADSEKTVIKERRRWHIKYEGVPFYLNLDQLIEPEVDDFYLEIKSRTWSLKDADAKSGVIQMLLQQLQIEDQALILDEYVTLFA